MNKRQGLRNLDLICAKLKSNKNADHTEGANNSPIDLQNEENGSEKLGTDVKASINHAIEDEGHGKDVVPSRRKCRKNKNPQYVVLADPLSSDRASDDEANPDDERIPEDDTISLHNLSTNDGCDITESNNNNVKMQTCEISASDAIDLSITASGSARKDDVPTPSTSCDATALRNYAESTMTELLNMYGLEGNTDKITDSVSLNKFSPKKISTDVAHRDSSSTLNGVACTSPVPSEQTIPLAAGRDEDVGLYAKFVNSMQKLAQIPQGSVIGNPPAVLPSNLTPADPRVGVIPANLSNTSSSNTPRKAPKPVCGGSSPVASFSTDGKGSPSKYDYTKYVRRYPSFEECGGHHCRDLSYKEHFHCMDCSFRVFVKKEEMIRHFKWHKKRDDSLQHGFMRYSPMDDCFAKFGACTHNSKQTHYHCLQAGCMKVYISTSDVQMHANYHRKDSAIIQEGFQRFRATEDCGTVSCAFYGQRTTHFHCRRTGCNFTFKNKADMEKHKTYHQRDEVLAKDGFKKFMKYEYCPYPGCRYSKVSNHIHCIRAGCDYILHSTGQLYSHKRKHERRDFEFAYKRFKDEQRQKHGVHALGVSPPPDSPTDTDQCSIPSGLSPSPTLSLPAGGNSDKTAQTEDMLREAKLSDSLNLPIPNFKKNRGPTADVERKKIPPEKKVQEMWTNYLTRFTANDPCHSRCEMLFKDHYHCNDSRCTSLFKTKDNVREHARYHEQQERVVERSYKTSDGETCDAIENCPYAGKEIHYHCTEEGCGVIVAQSDGIFNCLDHYRIHDFQRLTSKHLKQLTPPSPPVGGPDTEAYKRKRGRPPKYPKTDIPIVPKVEADDFQVRGDGGADIGGFRKFETGEPCPDTKCVHHTKEHYHCTRPRCHHATDRMDVLVLHCRDFHNYVTILDGYEFFDRNVNCRRPHCHNNRANRHFHCVRPKCDYSFVRYSTMVQHNKKHGEIHEEAAPTKTDPILTRVRKLPIPQPPLKDAKDTIKATGTFFPLSGLTGGPNAGQGLLNTATGNHFTLTPSPASHPPSTRSASMSCQPASGVNEEEQSEGPLIHEHQNTPEDVKSKIVSAMQSLLPLTLLLQHKVQTQRTNAIWEVETNTMIHAANQNCGRPFCKMKKRDHFHCRDCNQTFTDSERLRTHLVNKHNYCLGNNAQKKLKYHEVKFEEPAAAAASTPPMPSSSFQDGNLSSSLTLNPGHFSQMVSSPNSIDQGGDMQLEPLNLAQCNLSSASTSPTLTAEAPRRSGRKRTPTQGQDFVHDPPVKTRKTDPVNVHVTEDKNYAAYAPNSNCALVYPRCILTKVAHFHCLRPGCGYCFADRGRMLQHKQQHDKLSAIMGEEFKRYRSSTDCERSDCEYSSKASHFHCIKCPFICTDTTKMLAHRKHHVKQTHCGIIPAQ